MPDRQTVTATAPGKLILMGEHAAVYGRPALVAAFGLRTRAVLTAAGSDAGETASVALDLPDVGVSERVEWRDLLETAARFRRAWARATAEGPTTEGASAEEASTEEATPDEPGQELERLRRGRPARVVELALAETLSAVGAAPPAIELRVASELPVGSGFGSSASVAVAVSGALHRLLTGGTDPQAIERIALEVERREHGRPSGIDHGTVLDGGLQWIERSAEGGLVRRRLPSIAALPASLAVFDTGSPAESTGEVVEGVRRNFEGRAERLESILEAMERDVGALREWLLGGRGEPRQLVELIVDFERRLEELGVVPGPVRELVRRVEAAGGAAKISGAGALSGSAAGSLLVYHPERPPAALPELARLRALEAELGVPGLRVESSG